MQTVRIALEETIAVLAKGKRADEVLTEYVTAVAVYQLHSKPTLMAIKVVEEPGQWTARVSLSFFRYEQ